MANNYLSVVYDEKSHPYELSLKLCAYLFQAFGMQGDEDAGAGAGEGNFYQTLKN